MRHDFPRMTHVLPVLVVLLVSCTGMTVGGVVRAPQSSSQSGALLETRAAAEVGSYDFTQVDEEWTMRDGITLPVSVFTPVTKTPGETFPAIIVINGWLLDKTYPCWMAEHYAKRGYIGVAVAARGWFGAGGRIGCMDPELDIRDVSDVITLLAQDERFPVLEDDRGPVVGVTGYSMGGCFSFMIAPRKNPRAGDPGDPRVRAIVPMHGSFDLIFSLYANRAPKWLWITFLLFGAYMGKISGFMVNLLGIIMNQRLDCWQKLSAVMSGITRLCQQPISDVNPDLMAIYNIVMQYDISKEEEAKQFFKLRSARYWCDEQYDGAVEHPITVPTLILSGWNDDLFFANEGLMAFSHCEGPKRMIITNRGHAGDFVVGAGGMLPLDAEGEWLVAQVDGWFDRFLKGIDNGAEKEPRVCFYREQDPGHYGQADRYPLPGTLKVEYFLACDAGGSGRLSSRRPPGGKAQTDLFMNIGFSGTLSFPYMKDFTLLAGVNPVDIPTTVKLADIPYTERSYLSRPLSRDLTIMGVPQVVFHYQSSQPFAELNPSVYEVKPDGTEILVSRGWFVGYNPEAWSVNNTESQPVEMQACYHRFEAGSRIKLRIATADPPQVLPYLNFAVILLHHSKDMPSSLILPVVPNSY